MFGKLSAVLLAFLLLANVAFADDSERRFIREGMTEGEVMVKIGRPTASPSTPAAARRSR